MHTAQEFAGGVYHASLPNGRVIGQVEIDTMGVRLTAADGTSFQVAFEGMELELSGGGGSVVLCHGPNRETTVFCADPAFLPSLAAGLHAETSEAATRLMVGKIKRRWYGRAALWIVVGLIVLAVVLVPPLFGWMVERTVRALPTSLDKQLGDAVIGQVTSSSQEVQNPVVTEAMAKILERLRQHVPEGYDEWEFRVMVVQDPTVNAFALPGGQMVFHSGLLAQAESADEVAGVMAHEMAHVLERHGLQRIAQSVGVVAAVGLMFGDTGVLVAAAAEYLTMAAVNSYSRGDESEADRISVTMMHRAGLEPEALGAMFERMKKEGVELPDILHWVSTHPSHDHRIEAIEEMVGELGDVEKQPLEIDWNAVREALK